MTIELFDRLSREVIPAKIYPVFLMDKFPGKSTGWNFSWRLLYENNPEGMFFAVSLRATPHQIEGMLMLEIKFGEMTYMPNVEIAPHNIGGEGRYRNVAGCLLAFGCGVSFTHGKGSYHGYLSFTSKTELIELYMDQYGAQIAAGRNMYFSPQAGKALMKKYLNVDSDLTIETS